MEPTDDFQCSVMKANIMALFVTTDSGYDNAASIDEMEEALNWLADDDAEHEKE